ncbi:MAG: D-ribose pyranase [Actinobacteria bacterium]|nr:D-ribose pyranase [Actinomycetota bacterium]
MKKDGIINSQLSRIVALMGHGDLLTVSDAGLPIPPNVELVDLAVSRNVPSFIDILKSILSELEVEKAIVAKEMRSRSPQIYDGIAKLVKNTEIIEIDHNEFKELTKKAKVIIRTGEFTPYANVILQSGVVF